VYTWHSHRFRFCSFLFAFYVVWRQVNVLLFVKRSYTLFVRLLFVFTANSMNISTEEHYCILCFFHVIDPRNLPIRTFDTIINRWCNIRFRQILQYYLYHKYKLFPVFCIMYKCGEWLRVSRWNQKSTLYLENTFRNNLYNDIIICYLIWASISITDIEVQIIHELLLYYLRECCSHLLLCEVL